MQQLQVAIDGCEKVFEINVEDEISRIRRMSCMNRDHDYPAFMKYTHKIATTKNGKDRPAEEIKKDRKRIKRRIDSSIVCPMNWMQECLDRIQGAAYHRNIDTKEFFVPNKNKRTINRNHISKVFELIIDYDNMTKNLMIQAKNTNSNDCYDMLKYYTEKITEDLSSMNLSASTVNTLIGIVLGIDSEIVDNIRYKDVSRYTRKVLK